MMNHIFISFSAVLMYELSYISIKLLKGRFKTDLNLKRFPTFSNRISGPSSGDNESKNSKSLLHISVPKRS